MQAAAKIFILVGMKVRLTELWEDFLALWYPDLCPACGQEAPAKGEVLCLLCQYALPQTQFHLQQENPLTERFWGRIPLVSGAALFHFAKGSKVQRLIHQFKYHQRRDIGLALGRYYGRQLSTAPAFANIDVIVPIPAHPKKEHRRGYNQAAVWAQGLSEELNKPVAAEALRRPDARESQTTKSRLERLANVSESYALGDCARIDGKHLLLVDDVITTGATLEACALILLTRPGVRISIATIAIAD